MPMKLANRLGLVLLWPVIEQINGHPSDMYRSHGNYLEIVDFIWNSLDVYLF